MEATPPMAPMGSISKPQGKRSLVCIKVAKLGKKWWRIFSQLHLLYSQEEGQHYKEPAKQE